jgi:hypothetical protein
MKIVKRVRRVLSQKLENGEVKGTQNLEKIFLQFCNLSVALLDKIMNILGIRTQILISKIDHPFFLKNEEYYRLRRMLNREQQEISKEIFLKKSRDMHM